MTIKLKVEGFREIERALLALPSGTAKGIARRAMRKELQPIADMANSLWPGKSRDVFRITSRLDRRQRRDSQQIRGNSVLNLFVGATSGKDGHNEAHLLEFGTGPRFTRNGAFRGAISPRPMLQPAWDAHKAGLLPGLGNRLWEEIRKTIIRRERRAGR